MEKVYAVTEALIASANQRNINIELGQLICNPCRNRIRKKVKNPTESVASSSSHQPDQPTAMELDTVDLDATIGPQTSSESNAETRSSC